jgi:hypothetical protein
MLALRFGFPPCRSGLRLGKALKRLCNLAADSFRNRRRKSVANLAVCMGFGAHKMPMVRKALEPRPHAEI